MQKYGNQSKCKHKGKNCWLKQALLWQFLPQRLLTPNSSKLSPNVQLLFPVRTTLHYLSKESQLGLKIKKCFFFKRQLDKSTESQSECWLFNKLQLQEFSTRKTNPNSCSLNLQDVLLFCFQVFVSCTSYFPPLLIRHWSQRRCRRFCWSCSSGLWNLK